MQLQATLQATLRRLWQKTYQVRECNQRILQLRARIARQEEQISRLRRLLTSRVAREQHVLLGRRDYLAFGEQDEE